jgi:predicted RNA binding protein YcfA (HicA-like mRNA interferase family)
MNREELMKRLHAEGWIRTGGKGDHMKFKHPAKRGHVVVPHPRKDIRPGTLRHIYRQAGWDWKE